MSRLPRTTEQPAAADAHGLRQLDSHPVTVALVVGAGAATGSAIARAFAAEGYHVCAVRRNGDRLAELVKSIRESGGQVTPFGVDCRKEEEVVRLVEEVESKIGPIKVCVHNIGANVRFSLLETTARIYRKVWEMAAFSAFLVTREVAKRMVARKEGTILITGATASMRGASHFSAFAGAKHAKRALAQSAARELMPKGIHVCHVIVDGAIDTPWITKLFGEERMAKMRQNEAVLKPESIAKLYVTLSKQDKSVWTHELDEDHGWKSGDDGMN
eukprot:CAMPEP_0170188938 /NCGR_PEP_ID=MMETSP0040_2-20121228/45583_1 /TAXON_ID=641309 /ORGANISM="Lotharella oceanica, Strain CCMP622" /LENGTH=272 /DNA_ID=CAMNT_0010436361 /DNA_START=18 /DNA_END=837 /DNA_ORIENTATION=-